MFRVEPNKITEFIRDIIKDINNKELVNYDYIPYTTVYASKENIEKLKQNYNLKEEMQKQIIMDNLNNSINELENRVLVLENQNAEAQSNLENNQVLIDDLENQIIKKI